LVLALALVVLGGLALGFFVSLPGPGDPDCLDRMQKLDSVAFISFDAEGWCGER